MLGFLHTDKTSSSMASTLDTLQKNLDLIFSHINSTPKIALNGKTPYEAFEFLYGKDILTKLHIQKIEKDMITLQPYLYLLNN